MIEMNIKDILDEFSTEIELFSVDLDKGPLVHDIAYDSRSVEKNALFVAVEGFASDGHRFIESAIEKGASAIVINRGRRDEFSALFDRACFLGVDDTRRALSYLSAFFFGNVSRSIPVIGVTGTNGKTSITYMIEKVLEHGGKTPGVMGTVNYRWKDKVIPAPNTTPESRDIHKIMRDMSDDGVDVIIMEVSSHGLYLGRADDIHFACALFTNLTQDHLDFHKDFEEYYQAKKKLFTLLEASAGKHNLKKAIVNCDADYGLRLYDELGELNIERYSLSKSGEADYAVDNSSVNARLNGLSFALSALGERVELDLHCTALFNIYNGSLAFAACHQLGLDVSTIKEGIESLAGVPGRFERISSNEGYHVIVDYAHTSDALEKVLISARELQPKRLVTIFGCGGDRDKTKRPLMGAVALKLSDYAVVTSDNPRTEDPVAIIDDILEGMKGDESKYTVIQDRESAIREAILGAKSGDLIVVAGKGHEDYQILGTTKIHFDDREIAAKYMKERGHL